MRISRHMILGSLAALALSSLAAARPAAAAEARYDPGPIMLPVETGFGGSGPIHRPRRFKRNQRKQRKGRK